MSFLKKLGEVLAKGVAIWFGFSGAYATVNPNAAGTIQTIDKDLAQIAQIVVEVETIGQTLNQPGPQKLTAAAPLVAQVILQSAFMVNHKINDEALFTKGCGEMAGGMADILNSLKDNVDQVTTAKT